MPKTRLLFVSQYYGNRSDISSPLFFHNAAYQLQAYLETVPEVRKAYSIEIPDLSGLPPHRRGLTDEDDLNLLDAILRRRPRIVAFSLYCWNVVGMHELARTLRQVAPDILLLAGGPEVYDRRDFVRQFPAFDVLVEGDGELPLRAVLERGVDEDLRGIPNVSFRRRGRWIHNPTRPAVCQMDAIPNYYAAHREELSGIGFYLTTRGCRNGCDYCLWARQPLRQKSRAKVLEELETLIVGTRLRRLILFDYDLFELYRDDRALLDAIAAMVRRRGPGFALSLFANSGSIADAGFAEMVERMAVHHVIAGLETGRCAAARAVHRVWQEPWDVPFAAADESLRKHLVIELMYPLPGETPASFRATVERLLGLGYFRLRIFHLMVLRGTRLRQRASELGLRYLERPPYFCLETPTSSRADTVRIGRLGFVLTLMTNVFDRLPDEQSVRRWYVADRGRIVGRILAGIDRGLHPDEIVRREVRSICGVDYRGSFVRGEHRGPPEAPPSLAAFLQESARRR
ncbi:MAG: hypothetical protein GYA57_14775 [Myxococcales bacterium]|nr:hypothetical protein [Myxococcales bacterium]